MSDLAEYSSILRQIADKTSAMTTITAFSGNYKTGELIQNWNEARALMCQLCDAIGHVKQDVSTQIANSILPESMGTTEDMQRALTALSFLFTILDNVWTFDKFYDSRDPDFINRRSKTERNRIHEDPQLTTKVFDEYFEEALIKDGTKVLKRKAVVDIVHDAFMLLQSTLKRIAGNPIWGNDYPDNVEKRRLDKFVGDHADKFIRQSTTFFALQPNKPTRLSIGVAPDTWQELKDLIWNKVDRFAYLFNFPEARE